jgi:predicted aconitase with swiveling domain
MEGRVICRGRASGEALVSSTPISFLGGIDPKTGKIIEKGHEHEGKTIAGKVFVFPSGKGSTVGSYVIYQLARNGKAPAAIVNAETEPIIAQGAILGGIPCVDRIDISRIRTGDSVTVDNGRVIVDE